ncbi:hypothetical protein [Pseudomonas sp. NPDC086278]|uniref:hypothetical protein n=1 Tax=Pseudomonas sp. NPDC086278 TaxID=3390646 RepID=UPI003D034ABD
MIKKVSIAAVLFTSLLMYGCASYADQPYVDIGGRHGNLRNAQEHISAAWQAISAAQSANDSRLGGHAARAKELLSEANEELRMAADAANRNER